MLKHAMDVKVNVQPIFSNVVHTAVWEGPCRVGRPEILSPEYESRAGKEEFKSWKKTVVEGICAEANVLEPLYIEYDETFYVSDEKLHELAPNPSEIDLFLITYRVPGIERLGIPVSMINCGPTPVDLVAFYRDIGLDAYMAHDYDEFNDIVRRLQVKKALANTKLLVLTADEQFPVSVNSSNPDIYGLNLKYGIRSTRHSIREVFDYMDSTTSEERFAADAKALSDKAEASTISDKLICHDLDYMNAVKSMMEKFGCNAFTTACKELCASRLPMRNKCTPCLTHSLLRNDRIPTACEEDLNAWMAIAVLMYLTKKAPFMGNPSLVKAHKRPIEDLGMTRLVAGPAEGFDEEVLEVRHAVPPTKLLGYDKPEMPFELGHFTYEGFGTKVQVNMADTDDKTVTIARFDRHGEKMIAAKGEIVSCAYRDIECSPAVYYHIDGGAREFRHALADGGYGHHLVVVYGDYRDELKKLAKIVGFEMEIFN